MCLAVADFVEHSNVYREKKKLRRGMSVWKGVQVMAFGQAWASSKTDVPGARCMVEGLNAYNGGTRGQDGYQTKLGDSMRVREVVRRQGQRVRRVIQRGKKAGNQSRGSPKCGVIASVSDGLHCQHSLGPGPCGRLALRARLCRVSSLDGHFSFALALAPRMGQETHAYRLRKN